MEFVKNRRCVIVAAGEVGRFSFIGNNISEDDFVIAADAGYLTLLKADIKPDLIVGDFDSADLPETDIETIALNPVKDCTDTEFAVETAVKRGYNDILILGALGGRVDHSFANIVLTAQFKNKGVNITLINENTKIYALKNETRTLKKANTYVSVFSFGSECTVTLEGMFYPLKEYRLSPFSALGVSNEIIENSASIEAGGVLIVMEASKN